MGGVGGGRLFEGGRLLTFSAFGMGAYSRWALIRGWALIRINTVSVVSVVGVVAPVGVVAVVAVVGVVGVVAVVAVVGVVAMKYLPSCYCRAELN